MNPSLLIALVSGLLIGILSGLTGTGGAFLIPVLVYIFGMTQLRAQGTALLVAAIPIWIAPLVPYWRNQQVDVKLGLVIAAALLVGGYLGAAYAQRMPQEVLRKGFAIVLALVAVKMFFQK
jgi:uncharacterized membrane protein YfcA